MPVASSTLNLQSCSASTALRFLSLNVIYNLYLGTWQTDPMYIRARQPSTANVSPSRGEPQNVSKQSHSNPTDMNKSQEPLLPGHAARVEKSQYPSSDRIEPHGESTMHERYNRTIKFALVLLLLAISAWIYWLHPEEDVISLAVATEKHRPKPFYPDIVLVQDLDEKFLPSNSRGHRGGRLVIIGDVHGMKDELVKLLAKVDFDEHVDHLVLTGDLVAKGPDSLGVLDVARDLNASCVRGNHEDRILYYYHELHKKGKSRIDEDKLSIGQMRDLEVAKALEPHHAEWIKTWPVILRVGEIDGMGEVVVVHGGLVPGLSLSSQDPYYTMNMRSLYRKTNIPSSERDGTAWPKVWNKVQSLLSKKDRRTVVYGHDSKIGLNIERYSKGLDSGCVAGGKLSALVIEQGKSKIKQKVVHVRCPAMV